MNDILKLQKKIIPEMIEVLEKRYNILRNVYYNEPIGRRTLANNLNVGERIIRSEVNILKEQGLLEIKSMGMNITDEGKKIIDELKNFIHNVKDLSDLEKKLKEKLKIKRVIIVPGNYDDDELVIKDLGKRVSEYLIKTIKNNYIIGITGGKTMAEIAEEIPNLNINKDILVIPARGGIGKNLETQSNNIAAKIAKKLGGTYKLLHVPDNIGREAFNTLLKIDEVKELIETIKKINLLIFGIGRADEMANRRNLPNVIIKELLDKGAVAESFGYYFNKKGEIVRESTTVGLSLDDFNRIDNLIGVACGTKKADAIISISSLNENISLFIDEGVARKILTVNKATM